MTDTTDSATESADGWTDDSPDEGVGSADAPAEEATDAEPDEEPKSKAGKEAARYRTQLRDTEAKLAVLQARIEGHQTADAERVAATVLADPGDLWLMGTSLADVLDEDGEVDSVLVEQKAREIVARRPGLAPPHVDMGQGRRGDRSPGATTWSTVLKGA